MDEGKHGRAARAAGALALLLLATAASAAPPPRPPATTPARPPTATVSVLGDTIAEGASGTSTLTFTVALSAALRGPVTVRYATQDRTANAASGDYESRAGELRLDAGATSATVDVVVHGDTLEEPDETFALVLSQPTGAALGTAEAIGEIVDDDGGAGPGPGPLVSVRGGELNESHGGGVRFVVTLSDVGSGTVTVNYSTYDGSATAGEDYTATTGVLRFPQGVKERQVAVPVSDDGDDEGDEDFTLELSDPVGATLGENPAIAVILDDDEAGSIVLDIVGSPERQSQPGRTVMLQVRVRTLSGAPPGATPVTWAVDGDAELLDGATTIPAANGIASQRVRVGNVGRLAIRATDPTGDETALFQIAVGTPPGTDSQQ